MSKVVTHEDFVKRVGELNPSITILSGYVNAKTHVTAKCNRCGNTWLILPSNAYKGRGCPECSRYKTHDEFAQELTQKNQKVKLVGTYLGVKEKVDVECLTCGRRYKGRPDQLLDGHGCAKCAGNLRKYTLDYTELLRRPGYENIEIVDAPSKSYQLIGCLCKECGNIWRTRAKRFSIGVGCPVCHTTNSRRLHQDFVSDLEKVNPFIQVIGDYTVSKDPVLCKCVKCGHLWSPIPNYILSGYGCPACNERSFTGNKNAEFYLYYIQGASAFGYGITSSSKKRHSDHKRTFFRAGVIGVHVLSVYGKGDVIFGLEKFAKTTIPVYNTGLKGFLSEAMVSKDVWKLILYIDRMIEDGKVQREPLPRS